MNKYYYSNSLNVLILFNDIVFYLYRCQSYPYHIYKLLSHLNHSIDLSYFIQSLSTSISIKYDV